MRLPGVLASKSRAGGRAAAWPWAAGSILAVALVIGGALAGHHIVAAARQNAALVSPPALAPVDVVAVTDPSMHIGLVTLDAAAGHLAVLATTGPGVWPQCPPVGSCPIAPAYDTFAVLDGVSGRPLAETKLAGAPAASGARLLLMDAGRQAAYAVGSDAIQAFSTLSAAPGASYAVPSQADWQGTRGGALESADGTLVLTDGRHLLALDAATGRELARQALVLPPGTQATDGPRLDAAQSRLYILARSQSASTLLAYDARTLAPAGQWELLAGARLGPMDDTGHALYIFPPNGTVSRLSASTLAAGTTSLSSSVVPALDGADAFGWNAQLGHFYAAAETLAVRDGTSGQTLATLPLRVAGSPGAALQVDAARALVYLPTAAGEVVIAHDTPDHQPLSAATALLLARAALARFLPDTNQDPPFVTPQSFPAGAGSRTQDYWIHFSDLGWQGPYAGSASSGVSPKSGHPGAFVVSLSIAWNQLFPRSHTWVCGVRADGSVQLQSQSGDAVP
jgi:hypothetical protein